MNSMQRLIEANAVKRLVSRDASLFTADLQQKSSIAQRLGWTDLAERGELRIPLIDTLVNGIIEEGATDVVLLGMGGSSLAALVFEQTFGVQEGGLNLHVLDTIVPETVAELMGRLDPAKTWFLLSSKSGATVEPISLYHVFRGWMNEQLDGPKAGKHFIVITDPDSPMQAMRQKEVMRVAVNAPPNVGGRFSALSLFGLLPAGMLGVDLKELLHQARLMERACAAPAEVNPAAQLASWIADSYMAGRDKLTFITSKRYASFGLWAEQLVAESTGKDGVGIIPILEPADFSLSGLGQDRAVVVLRDAEDFHLEEIVPVIRARSCPVMEFAMDDPIYLGAEFVRWEYAVGLLGHLLGVNPFDEPDVSQAKSATSDVLTGDLVAPMAAADLDGIWPSYAGMFASVLPPASLSSALSPLVASIRPGDYLAILTYLPTGEGSTEPLHRVASEISARSSLATTIQYGPRYLHSTGQLHKGGPDKGVFLMLTARKHVTIPVPRMPYSLEELYRSQAEGDLVTLGDRNRRVMRLDLPDTHPSTINRLVAALASAFS